LFYRQGYPFWADGINVPFNYISGYVAGVLSVSDDPADMKLALELLQPLLNEEGIRSLPNTWRYWWAEGQKGWGFKQGLSLNTPEWHGNIKGADLAHITYRTMDATSLLMLYRKTGSGLNFKEALHFKSLVEKGMLLPQLNEQLSQINLRAQLSQNVAKRFSRSSQAWQIQSQVWALSDMSLY
jgi:hypothetical protein